MVIFTRVTLRMQTKTFTQYVESLNVNQMAVKLPMLPHVNHGTVYLSPYNKRHQYKVLKRPRDYFFSETNTVCSLFKLQNTSNCVDHIDCFGEIVNPQKFFFPGCDRHLSSPYIISIFEYIVKHAGDWNKEAISQKARNAALNPHSLYAQKVSDRLEGRSFTRISVRKGQFDFHTT